MCTKEIDNVYVSTNVDHNLHFWAKSLELSAVSAWLHHLDCHCGAGLARPKVYCCGSVHTSKCSSSQKFVFELKENNHFDTLLITTVYCIHSKKWFPALFWCKYIYMQHISYNYQSCHLSPVSATTDIYVISSTIMYLIFLLVSVLYLY